MQIASRFEPAILGRARMIGSSKAPWLEPRNAARAKLEPILFARAKPKPINFARAKLEPQTNMFEQGSRPESRLEPRIVARTKKLSSNQEPWIDLIIIARVKILGSSQDCWLEARIFIRAKLEPFFCVRARLEHPGPTVAPRADGRTQGRR